MKKPEKKKIKQIIKKGNNPYEGTMAIRCEVSYDYSSGYNKCIDDYEKFLPSEGEINKMICSNLGENSKNNFYGLAITIARRIGVTK